MAASMLETFTLSANSGVPDPISMHRILDRGTDVVLVPRFVLGIAPQRTNSRDSPLGACLGG